MRISWQASLNGNLAKNRKPPNCDGIALTWSTAVIWTLLSNLLAFVVCCLLRLDTESESPKQSLLLQLSSSSSNQPSHYNLAFDQSYGFFDDIANADWQQFYQTPAREAQHYHHPKTPNEGVKDPSQWNFYNWDRYFNCPHLQKVGGLGGGPKWTCDVERLRAVVQRRRQQQDDASRLNNKSHCLVYSIGSKGNFRWELGLVDILGADTCEIHVFDFGDYERPDLVAKNIHFHQWGLGSSYSPEYRRPAIERGQPFLSFAETRRRLGHENRTIDLFKIDCETCEWYVVSGPFLFLSLMSPSLYSFRGVP